ncbi:MAG: hypothetical protein ACYDCJ_13735, partial [Gammaproteobacteria bacterium]
PQTVVVRPPCNTPAMAFAYPPQMLESVTHVLGIICNPSARKHTCANQPFLRKSEKGLVFAQFQASLNRACPQSALGALQLTALHSIFF